MEIFKLILLSTVLMLAASNALSWDGFFETKFDRVQVLPSGSVNFWRMDILSTACGSQAKPWTVRDTIPGVDVNGIKGMTGILLTALTADKTITLHQTPDNFCGVDAITLHK